MGTCICVAEPLCCPPETIMTLFIGYTPNKVKKKIFFLIKWAPLGSVLLRVASVWFPESRIAKHHLSQSREGMDGVSVAPDLWVVWGCLCWLQDPQPWVSSLSGDPVLHQAPFLPRLISVACSSRIRTLWVMAFVGDNVTAIRERCNVDRRPHECPRQGSKPENSKVSPGWETSRWRQWGTLMDHLVRGIWQSFGVDGETA